MYQNLNLPGFSFNGTPSLKAAGCGGCILSGELELGVGSDGWLW